MPGNLSRNLQGGKRKGRREAGHARSSVDDSMHGMLLSQSGEVRLTQTDCKQPEVLSLTLVENGDQLNVCHNRMGFSCTSFSRNSCICPLTVL